MEHAPPTGRPAVDAALPAPAVPDGLDGIDADWLTAALAHGGHTPSGLRVVAVEVTPLGAGVGFLGDLARLRPTYGADGSSGPASFVAKAPTRDPGGREVGRILSVWPRESRFFADLADRCPARVPRCYYNGADAEHERWMLVLEDCGPGIPTDEVTGATPDQARAAIAEIARFAATWWNRPRPVAWLPGFDLGPATALAATVADAVEPFVHRFGPRLPGPTVDWLRAFAPRLGVWWADQATGPLTVVHADYRLDNLIFQPDGGIVILDWQTALFGPGAMDLTSFLATSLVPDARRELEDELLGIYADGVGAGVDRIRQGYRSHLLWWMALYANNLSRIDPADPRGATLFDGMVDRTFTAALDHAVGDLIV